MTTTAVLDSLGRAEETTWCAFVDRFRPALLRFARHHDLSADEAEDVVQETLVDFLRAYRAGQYDRDRGRLRGWLFGIAHRRVLNAHRRRGRGPRPMPPGQRTAVLESLPDKAALQQSWDESWEQAVVAHCLEHVRREIEPRTLEAFEAFALRGQPAAAVAREFSMSENAVYVAKHRVMKRLSELRTAFE